MPQRFTFNDDDDFEQFDEIPSKKNMLVKEDDSSINESFRTRRIFKTSVNEPILLSETELRLKINQRAINYLAKREYSRVELRNKLVKDIQNITLSNEESIIHELINYVLDDLSHQNWQSDQRYAEQITRVKGTLFGVIRLKQEFKQRGLSDELMKKELGDLKNTELARATEVWQRKFGCSPINLKERAKQARFMASRGFDFETFCKILKNNIVK